MKYVHIYILMYIIRYIDAQQQQWNYLGGGKCAVEGAGAGGESIINNFISCQAKRQQMRGLVKRLCVCVEHTHTHTHIIVYKLNKKFTKIVMLRHWPEIAAATSDSNSNNNNENK